MNDLIQSQRLGLLDQYAFRQKWHLQFYEDLDKSKEVHLKKTNGGVNSLSVENVDFRYLLSGGADGSIRVYDLNSKGRIVDGERQSLAPLTAVPQEYGHKFGVSSIHWWPFDSGLFVSSSFDGTVKVWDPNTLEAGEEAYSFDLGCNIYNISISTVGDHSLVATAADHPFIRLLDLRTTSSSHTLAARGTRSAMKNISVKWSPKDSHILASGASDGSVRIWDIRQSNSCITCLDMQQTGNVASNKKDDYRFAHRGAVNGLAWFPNGDYLISNGNDEKIRLWSLYPLGGRNMLVNYGPLIRNRHVQTLDPCLSPSEDLQFPYLFFPSDSGEIFMFRAIDGKVVKRLNRGAGKLSNRTLCFVPRGNSTFEYYSGTMDGTIQCWSPQAATEDLVEHEEEDTQPRILDDVWKSIQAQKARRDLLG